MMNKKATHHKAEPLNILIIDDHPSYLEGVSLLLQSIMPRAQIVRSLTGAEAKELLIKRTDFDWILLDINLPDCSGIDLIRHFNDIKLLAHIVVITSDDDPAIMDLALTLHVSGFLTKDFDFNVLSQCVAAIENNNIFLLPKHAQQLKSYRENSLREKQLIQQTMSQRQQQALLLLAKGCSNLEIANLMSISESTVKTHVSCLIALFEADNRTHCVIEARRLNFVD